MKNPVKVDLPYPDISDLQPDAYSAQLIAPSYAGQNGELTAILQYQYHGYYLDCDKEVLDLLQSIALCEMEHFEVLGQTLLKLGVPPTFTNYPPYKFSPYNTSSVGYSCQIHKILLDDITGETLAIAEYERVLSKLTNEKVGAVISRILLDERLHVNALKEQLERLSSHTY